MLVLSRRLDETVVIGDDIVVTVVEARHGRVRLGISAPVDVAVHRGEVKDTIEEQKVRKPKNP